MAESFTLNIDTKGSIDEAVQALRNVRGGAKQAIARALNRTAGEVQTAASEEASQIFTVDKDSVKKRMYVSKATPSNPSVTITRRGPRWQARRFPIIENTNPGVRGGAAAAIVPRRNGGRMTLGAEGKLSKAFMVRSTNNNSVSRGSGLYRRIGNYRDRLVLARGLSVPDMLSEHDVRSIVEQRAEARLKLELDREIQELLNKGASS